MTDPTLAHDMPVASPTESAEIRHGTALRWLERGVLLLGPSGAGKSDLALRLIDHGADLVADDLIRIEACGGRLIAKANAAPGLIELRGQGIFCLPALTETELDLALELGPATERLPDAGKLDIAGIALPCHRLDPRAASATARLRVLLTRERVY
jgi:HPr kinase/phosphorylase